MKDNIAVLVVDDSNTWLDKAQQWLELEQGKHGYKTCTVYRATTPQDGHEILAAQQIDAVVLDINFVPYNPENKDGLDYFLKPARERGVTTPVLCWSSASRFRQIALNAGANEFINKAEVDKLPSVVARLISEHHT